MTKLVLLGGLVVSTLLGVASATTTLINVDDDPLLLVCPDIYGNTAGIAGVTVTAHPTGRVAVSDAKGNYLLKCLPRTSSVSVLANKNSLAWLNGRQNVSLPAGGGQLRVDFATRGVFESDFISQNIPTSGLQLDIFKSYPVQITMLNNGSATWRPGEVYLVSTIVEQYGSQWGPGAIPLAVPVEPGGLARFYWTMVPDGVCSFQGCGLRGKNLFSWQLKGPSGFFGAISPATTFSICTLNCGYSAPNAGQPSVPPAIVRGVQGFSAPNVAPPPYPFPRTFP